MGIKTYKVAIVLSPGRAAPNIMLGYEAALKNMGHDPLILDVRPFFSLSSQAEQKKFLENLRIQVQSFSPDFALGYNIDTYIFIPSSEGDIHIFEDLNIPYVSLFYDNPMTPGFESLTSAHIDSELYTVFIWDRYYLKQYSQKNNKEAYYLPLASDPSVFFPRPPHPSFSCDAGFIGSISSETNFDEARKKNGWDQWSIAFARQIIETKKINPGQPMDAIFNAVINTLSQQNQITIRTAMARPGFDHFIKSIDSELGTYMRCQTIETIPSTIRTNLYGDEGWLTFVEANYNYKGKISYLEEAPLVYTSSLVNLNITSNQLVDSANQRIFDIPACRGFLLTDNRPCLSELFDPGMEIMVYENLEDMKEKLTFYLKHENQREKIARNAYKRFLDQHTYSHRAEQIISTMEKNGKL